MVVGGGHLGFPFRPSWMDVGSFLAPGSNDTRPNTLAVRGSEAWFIASGHLVPQAHDLEKDGLPRYGTPPILPEMESVVDSSDSACILRGHRR